MKKTEITGYGIINAPEENKTILVGSFLENYSETQRMVDIGEELLKHGYKIIYPGKGKYDFLLEGHDFLRVQIKEDDEFFTKERCKKILEYYRYGHNYTDYESLDKIIQAELSVIKRYKPCLILTGYRVTFSVSARIAKTPIAWCLGAVASDSYVNQLKNRLATIDRRTLLGERKKAYQSDSIGVKIMLSPINNDVFNKYLIENGANPFGKIIDFYRGDLNLISDPRELFPDIKEDISNVFIGPIFHNEHDKMRTNVQKYTRYDQPQVMVTLGSAAKKEEYFRLLDELKDLECHFYVPTLGVISEEEIKDYPSNFQFGYSFDINQIMNICDACVIKGGQGTLYSAMLNAVPFVSITNAYEQNQNVENLLKYYQCGIHFYDGAMTKDSIKKALIKVLSNDSYGKEIERLSRMISSYNNSENSAAKNAADAIDRYILETNR